MPADADGAGGLDVLQEIIDKEARSGGLCDAFQREAKDPFLRLGAAQAGAAEHRIEEVSDLEQVAEAILHARGGIAEHGNLYPALERLHELDHPGHERRTIEGGVP